MTKEALLRLAELHGRIADANGALAREYILLAGTDPETRDWAPARDMTKPRQSKKLPEPVETEQGKTTGHIHEVPRFGEMVLTKVDRKILVPLAQLGKPTRLELLGVMGRFSETTGNVGVSVAKLRREGLLVGTVNDLHITSRGIVALDGFPQLPRGHSLFLWWCETLPTPAGKILTALRAKTESMSIDAIGEAMGFSSGTGNVGVAIALLRRNGFVQGSKDELAITESFAKSFDPTFSVYDTSSGRQVLLDRRGVAKS